MLPLTQNGNAVTKTCERCGEAFSCGPLFACWCFDMVLTEAGRGALEEKFSDCVCHICLDELGQIL